MSFASTRTKVGTVLAAATPNWRVHNRIRTDVDRADAESDLISSDLGYIACWEYDCTPSEIHGGATGYQRTAMRVRVRGTFKHDDANDSKNAFVDAMVLAMQALANPEVGFPQLDPKGILTTEEPRVPLKVRTDHSAYRCEFVFDLLDVETT